MKFIFTNVFLLLTCLGFGIYLFSTDTFLPYDSFGDPNSINIFIFVLLAFLIVFTVLTLLLFLIFSFTKKECTKRFIYFLSFKYALIISLGLLSVGVLNHFNVLDWVWGVSILGVVLLGLIII